MTDKLRRFLALVPAANWRTVPPVWHEELRHALNDNLVSVAWGGALKLTDAGRAVVTEG